MNLSDVAVELADVLKEEIETYKMLLELSQQKTNTITERKIPELEQITRKEHSLVSQITRLETAREELAAGAATILGMKSVDVTLSLLADRMPEKEAQVLSEYGQTMSLILKQLKNMNELNGKLIRNSLDYINFSINLMTGASQDINNYANTGHINSQKKRSLFDVKR